MKCLNLLLLEVEMMVKLVMVSGLDLVSVELSISEIQRIAPSTITVLMVLLMRNPVHQDWFLIWST